MSGVDDRLKTVGAAPADVGKREGDWRVISLQQSARTGALDCVVTCLHNLMDRFARKHAQHWNHDAVGYGDDEANIDVRGAYSPGAAIFLMPTIENAGMPGKRVD